MTTFYSAAAKRLIMAGVLLPALLSAALCERVSELIVRRAIHHERRRDDLRATCCLRG